MPITPKVRVEISAIDRATATIKGVSNQISGISSSLMKLGAAYATVRIGFAIFEQFTTKVAEYGEQLLIGAQRTGMTTEQIAGLGLMAKQKGLDLGDLTKALGILSRNLVGLGPGGKTAQRVLEDLGVGTKDAEGKLLPMHDLLLRLADRFASMPAGAQKAAAAMAIFGREGGRLIPFLNEGAKGIQEIEKRAAELGITLDEKSARAAHEFGDQMVILGEIIRGVALIIGVEMMPSLLKWTLIVENAYPLVKRLGYGLEFLAYSFITVAKATTFQITAMKDFWTLAQEALDKAAAAEEEYDARMSKGTMELAKRLATYKALGDIPDLGGAKEDKDAKRRLDELKKAFGEIQEGAAAYNKELRSIGETLQESWDPTIKATARMEELNQAFARGLISGDELSRGLEEIQSELRNLDPLLIAQREEWKKAGEACVQYQQNLDSAAKGVKDSLQTPAEKATATFRELTILLGTGRISADEFTQATARLQAGLSGAGDLGRKMGEEISGALTQMIVYGRGGIQMLESIVALLVQAIIKAMIFKPLFESFNAGTVGGGGGGFWGTLFGGILGGLIGLQGGGTVSAGAPYLVGEAGPELFVPEAAGAIVSNSEIGGDRYYYKIDARGADPSVALRIRQALREVHQNAVETAKSQIREESWRAGE
jgi:hypothetical protein